MLSKTFRAAAAAFLVLTATVGVGLVAQTTIAEAAARKEVESLTNGVKDKDVEGSAELAELRKQL